MKTIFKIVTTVFILSNTATALTLPKNTTVCKLVQGNQAAYYNSSGFKLTCIANGINQEIPLIDKYKKDELILIDELISSKNNLELKSCSHIYKQYHYEKTTCYFVLK